jgi:hypothetical protein
MEIQIFLMIIWFHFLSDFFFQTRWMGNNKSKNSWILALHCAIYSTPFFYFGPIYAVVNGVLHFGVDFITSRITSKCFEKNQIHWFFVTIGADQAIHMTILFLTYILLEGV